MRLLGRGNINAHAEAQPDTGRVLICLGSHRYSASRNECIALARELVAAVDATAAGAPVVGVTMIDADALPKGNTP